MQTADEHEAKWRQTFDNFDRNSDGTISRDEIQQALAAVGQRLTPEEVTQMLENVGICGQESLDFSKFVQVIKATGGSVSELNRSELKKMFQAMDLDLSGYLTAAELRHFMTEINIHLEDDDMAEMIQMYDLDGSGEITIEEFEALIKSMGYTIVEDLNDESASLSPTIDNGANGADKAVSGNDNSPEPIGTVIKLESLTSDVKEALSLFDFSESGEVSLKDLKEAADLLRKAQASGGDPSLHWDNVKQRLGLGSNVQKVNHIALIVSDVGRSAQFYSNVMGFQQIRRPNFDKHGAWFTMGNVELHLIKGIPIVHSGDDLIVSHISIETEDIRKVPGTLRKLGVPFRQNVSVPKGPDSGTRGTNTSNDSDSIVRQYFIRDPDGYYIEICNCQVLTKYCLGTREELAGYDEGVKPLSVGNAALCINLMQKWGQAGHSRVKNHTRMLETVKKTDGSVTAIAKLLGCKKADTADKELLENLVIRMSVYGDICQNETRTSLEHILVLSGNDADMANQIMLLKAENAGHQTFRPPSFFEGTDVKTAPPSFDISTA